MLIDPTHDFGKNTWHGLELVHRTAELVATGWPVLMALSNKDFVGETLDLPVDQRLEGTLAATAIAAWQGAAVFRAHQVLPHPPSGRDGRSRSGAPGAAGLAWTGVTRRVDCSCPAVRNAESGARESRACRSRRQEAMT